MNELYVKRKAVFNQTCNSWLSEVTGLRKEYNRLYKTLTTHLVTKERVEVIDRASEIRALHGRLRELSDRIEVRCLCPGPGAAALV